MARVFFNKWFAGINAENGLPRVYDKKLTIIALCTLMEMDPAGIPESLKEGWPGIVAGALRVFKDLPKALEGVSTIYLCRGPLMEYTYIRS
jgi:importin-7